MLVGPTIFFAFMDVIMLVFTLVNKIQILTLLKQLFFSVKLNCKLSLFICISMFMLQKKGEKTNFVNKLGEISIYSIAVFFYVILYLGLK